MKLFMILAACCVLALSQRVPQDGPPTATFRSGVSNVKIDIQVTNDRELVRDLTLKDFMLFDQERQRELLYVDRGGEPLSLVLLLDSQ